MTKTYSMRVGQARLAPFSLRLTADERATLQRRAGTMPVATYIKSVLFGMEPPRRSRARSPVRDHKALAEVLACLGASRIANNLNQLAKHANSGSLYFDRDTKHQLGSACGDIRAMRQLLMHALGIKLPAEPPAEQSISQSFARASGGGFVL
jgi:hypothetical protein